MTDNQKKILEMLAEKKISTDEAYRLLGALDAPGGGTDSGPGEATVLDKKSTKYLRVTVMPGENADPGHQDRVNVRVPMSLLRAGIKLTSLIPPNAYDKIDGALKDKGFEFDIRSFKKEDLEDVIEALGEMEVDVESGHGEKIKVFVE